MQLAAALVHDPELAVLDEPFSGLDPLGVASLGEMLLQTAATGVAVVFSSHQLDLVEDVCQDVVIIDHGRVVLAGVVEELKAASPHRSLEITVDGNPWVPVLPSGTMTSKRDGRLRVLVDASVDVADVLASARSGRRGHHVQLRAPVAHGPVPRGGLGRRWIMNGSARRLWLVARREWNQRLRTLAFRVSTLISILIVVALILVPDMYGGGANERTVGVVGAELVGTRRARSRLRRPARAQRGDASIRGRARRPGSSALGRRVGVARRSAEAGVEGEDRRPAPTPS